MIITQIYYTSIRIFFISITIVGRQVCKQPIIFMFDKERKYLFRIKYNPTDSLQHIPRTLSTQQPISLHFIPRHHCFALRIRL